MVRTRGSYPLAVSPVCPHRCPSLSFTEVAQPGPVYQGPVTGRSRKEVFSSAIFSFNCSPSLSSPSPWNAGPAREEFFSMIPAVRQNLKNGLARLLMWENVYYRACTLLWLRLAKLTPFLFCQPCTLRFRVLLLHQCSYQIYANKIELLALTLAKCKFCFLSKREDSSQHSLCLNLIVIFPSTSNHAFSTSMP